MSPKRWYEHRIRVLFISLLHILQCSTVQYSKYCVLSCSAYQNNDISEFERVLKTHRQAIMEDPFIREHIEGSRSLLSFVRLAPPLFYPIISSPLLS